MKLFYFYILLLRYQIVYPKSRYISMIDKTAGRLEVLKLHLNNISRSRFGENKNLTFSF